MSNVIVVPEKDNFRQDIFEGEVIYINESLGQPDLSRHNVSYAAPYLFNERRVLRVYHILEMRHVAPNYEIYLGNSFLVNPSWNDLNQNRRFEYHPLASFRFREERPGFLLPL